MTIPERYVPTSVLQPFLTASSVLRLAYEMFCCHFVTCFTKIFVILALAIISTFLSKLTQVNCTFSGQMCEVSEDVKATGLSPNLHSDTLVMLTLN